MKKVFLLIIILVFTYFAVSFLKTEEKEGYAYLLKERAVDLTGQIKERAGIFLEERREAVEEELEKEKEKVQDKVEEKTKKVRTGFWERVRGFFTNLLP